MTEPYCRCDTCIYTNVPAQTLPCSDCFHGRGGAGSPDLYKEQGADPAWKKDLVEKRAKERGAPVDSKIAAGSEKTTPFLKAMAAVFSTAFPPLDPYISAEVYHENLLRYWAFAREESEHRTVNLIRMAQFALLAAQRCEGLETAVEALAEVWRDSMFGESKHGANNWMNAKPEGMWHYEAAMVRHVLDRLLYGELVPEAETVPEAAGVTHVGCVAWNALMILEMHLRGVENPDWVQP